MSHELLLLAYIFQSNKQRRELENVKGGCGLFRMVCYQLVTSSKVSFS